MKLNLFIILAVLVLAVQCSSECPFNWDLGTPENGRIRCDPSVGYDYFRTSYPWQFNDAMNLKGARRRCEKDHPVLGCEKKGQIIYPKCKEGYKVTDPWVCTAKKCPEGWETVGIHFSVDYCLKK